MDLTRAEAVVDIAGRLRGWMAMGGILAADTPGQLGGVLDDVFRQFRIAEEDIPTAVVASSQIPAFRALSTVFTLRLVQDSAGPQVDISAAQLGVTKTRSEAWTQLAARLAKAEMAASRYMVVDSPHWASGAIRLDILEPRDPRYAYAYAEDQY